LVFNRQEKDQLLSCAGGALDAFDKILEAAAAGRRGAGSGEIDFIALFEGDNGLFPIRAASEAGGALAFFLALIVGGIDVDDGFFEEVFDSAFDVEFVGAGADPEDVLVACFREEGGFFGEEDGLDVVEGFVHFESLSEMVARASPVRRILS
jgi:hypothetical protein